MNQNQMKPHSCIIRMEGEVTVPAPDPNAAHAALVASLLEGAVVRHAPDPGQPSVLTHLRLSEVFPKDDPGQLLSGLNAFARLVHANAVAHGWWETERPLPEILMLCVTELAEAMEDYRKGMPAQYIYSGAEAKPCGIGFELADCVLRILDFCAFAGIDLEARIAQKHKYNEQRPHRHGGKIC